ncbi:Rho termination factor N-terminal domain-containing protein, partial [Agromyces sp. NPDC055658]
MTNASDHAARVANGAPLTGLKVAELQELAASLGIVGASKLRKGELVEAITARQAEGDAAPTLDVDGTAPVEAAPVADAPSAPAEAAPSTDPAPADAAPVDGAQAATAEPVAAEASAQPRRGRQPRRATRATTAAVQHVNGGGAGVGLV